MAAAYVTAKKKFEAAGNQPVAGGVGRHLRSKPAGKGSAKTAQKKPVGRPAAKVSPTAQRKMTMAAVREARKIQKERLAMDA